MSSRAELLGNGLAYVLFLLSPFFPCWAEPQVSLAYGQVGDFLEVLNALWTSQDKGCRMGWKVSSKELNALWPNSDFESLGSELSLGFALDMLSVRASGQLVSFLSPEVSQASPR